MELIEAAASWRLLLLALVVFGMAPGAVLRFVVLAFERDDPRRDELLAELHAVPRVERPFWVAEQIEVAIFEGLWERLRWAATGRLIARWRLGSGVERHVQHPDTFWIPSPEDKAQVLPGDSVKAMFEMRDGWGERMWVDVIDVRRRCVVGVLANQPVGIPRLMAGDKVKVKYDHIIDIQWCEEDPVGPPIDVDGYLRAPLGIGNGPPRG